MYNDNKVKPLHIVLPEINANVKSYDEQTKWMYFLIQDDDLLEKYNTIWDKVSADIKKEFDSEPVYNTEFLKTKIKSHRDEVTDFYDKKIPKVASDHIFLAVIKRKVYCFARLIQNDTKLHNLHNLHNSSITLFLPSGFSFTSFDLN